MNKKISELPAATVPLDGTELLEIVQGGINKQVAKSDVSTGGGAVDSVNGQTGVVQINADDVPFTPAGGIAATDVQAALEELDTEKASTGSVSTVSTNLSNHISDATDAHAASAITFTPAGGISATTVQAALEELDTEKVSPVGVQDLFIPAASMWPRVTGGCGLLTQLEMATSVLNIQALPFDQTSQEFAQFTMALPRKWNNGTVTVVPYWTSQSGSGTVQWGISGGAYSNDDALTVALGTAQTSDDTLIATNDLHIGPATAAITLAGTPADADFLAFQISRNPGSDTLSADALLLGVSIRITVDAATDV